jgi:hypothetical protein
MNIFNIIIRHFPVSHLAKLISSLIVLSFKHQNTLGGIDALSLLFFPITDRDCIALSYVDIKMLTPLMDEVVVACPPNCNNNDSRGRAIYDGVIVDPGGGTTHASSSFSSKLMVRVSTVCHHLQDDAPPQMLQSG